MKKRLTAMILTAALAFTMCGCGGIFDKEYSSVTDYTAPGEGSSDGKNTVKNYYGLKKAILGMVDGHEEGGVVVFDGYDGDISTDLKSACWEMRTQNALCAYCVESINYDLNHIVSYEEASIYIKYSRTPEEIDRVVTVSYSTGIKDYLLKAMNALQTKVVLLVNNSALDEDGVAEMVTDVYTEDPLCAITLPKASVYKYSGAGLQRLFEITLSYGDTAANISSDKARLSSAMDTAVKSCTDENKAQAALKACKYITDHCAYSAASENNTVYGVLMRGSAGSEGMALAMQAICSKLGVNCQVVRGLVNLQAHSWNIIQLDGSYYHVDASLCRTDGMEAGFLKADTDMWGVYRWDTGAYPECRGELSYARLTK